MTHWHENRAALKANERVYSAHRRKKISFLSRLMHALLIPRTSTLLISLALSSTCVWAQPSVVSISREHADPTEAASVDFKATFDESVTGVDATDFTLTLAGGLTGASVTGVSGSGVDYIVTVDTGTGDGTVRLDVTDDDSIENLATTPLGGVGLGNGDFTTGEVYTVDKTPPTVSTIVRTDTNPTNASSVDYTVTFSETVTAVDATDFVLMVTGVVTGASVTGVSGSGTTYTVTVDRGTGEGTIRLDVTDDDSIQDLSTNLLGGTGLGNGDFTTGEVYTVDTTSPTVSTIVRTDTDPTNASSVDFTVTFDESVTGVDTTDFAIDASGVTGASVMGVAGSGTTYTVTVATGTGDGTLSIDLSDDDSIQDLSTNLLGGTGLGNGDFTTGEVYTVDKTPPTVSTIVRADADPTNAASVDFTVTFDESVTGVDTTDFAIDSSGITGASVTGVAGSGTTYTVTVATGTGDGTLSIDLTDDDSIQDLSANLLGGTGLGNGDFTGGESYTVDTTSPAVSSIVRADANPTNAASVDYTVTFSESVTGVDTTDFVLTVTGAVSGASVTGVSGSGTTYTVSVDTGTGTGDGTIRLDVTDDDSIADAVTNVLGGTGAGNGDFTTGEVYTEDRDPIVSTIVRADTNPTNASSVDYTVTFSETVTGVDTTDFAIDSSGVTGASVTGVAGSGTTYTVTVDTGTGDGTIQLDVSDDDSITDGLGNALGGTGAGNGDFTTGEVYTVDKTPPTVSSIVRADTNPTNASSVDYTVTFSETVTGVNTTDFAIDVSGVTGASVTGVSGSGTTYTVTVDTGTGDGTIQLDVTDDDSIADGLGNTLGGTGAGNGDFTTGEVYTVDKTPPTVSSIVRTDTNPTNAASVDFTVTFDESVTGVDTTDFAIDASGVTGASVTGVSGSGTTYTVTVATGTGEGTIRLDVTDDDSIQDLSTNLLGGTGLGNGDFTTGEVYAVDTTSPTVSSIVRADANPTKAASVDYTVTISESVTGVDTTNFVLTVTGAVSGASVTGVSGSGTTYTVTVGRGTGEGTIRLDVTDDDSIADAITNMLGGTGAGNGNFTTGEVYTVDTTSPTVSSIVRADADPTNAASVDFTVTFDESVTGVDTTDFAIDSSGVTGASVTGVAGSGTTYTVTVATGTGDGTLSIDLSDDDSIADLATNLLGGAGLGNGDFTTGEFYTIDKTPPTVSSIVRADTNPTNSASVDYTLTFDESVTGVNMTDFVLTVTGDVIGASVTGVAGSGASYTVTVGTGTGTGDGTIRLDVADDDTIADLATNVLGGTGAGNGDFTTGEVYTEDRDPIVSTIVRADTNPTNASSVDFTVTFGESVTGVDTTDFAIDVSGVTGASVTGVAGSGMTYTVSVDTGTGDGTIQLDVTDDDSIADGLGNTLGGTGAGNGDFTTGEVYTVDKTPPTVSSIVRTDTNPTNASSVDFTLTFDESVTGVDTTDFAIDSSGVTSASVTSVAGSGTTYTVSVDTGTGDGMLSIDLSDDDSIADLATNLLGGTGLGNGDFTPGEVYTIDKTPPAVSTIVRVDTNPTNSASVDYTVTFSESVTGVDTTDFVLTVTGDVSGETVTGVAGSGTTYTVSLDTGTGDGTIRLDVADDDSIADLATNLLGGTGAGNGDFTTGEVYTVDKIPIVADITTDEDTQSGAIVIDRNANDGAEVTHFRIAAITNGSLFQNDGTTPISDDEYITYAEGQAGVKFTPSADSNTAGTFSVESSEDGTSVAAHSGAAIPTITITPIGDTPAVADITTGEDTQSGAIVVDRNVNDGAEVTHFRITAIANGALFQNDGTTPISNGEYIAYADGQAGVKFTPNANSIVGGSFAVESSEDGTSVAAQSGAATSTITITPIGDTPIVADITTDEDTQSGAIVVDRNGNDGTEVTHFRIAAITNGALFQNDGTTPISDDEYITYAEGQAGVKFTPGGNVTTAGTFTVEASENGTSVAAQSGTATSTITISPVGDTPVVADITTNEDTQSGAIVVDRNGNDSAEVTHFRIDAITNGTLFQNDGTTPIGNGEYITYAEGQSGLKFTPGANVTTAGTFTVEASEDGTSVAAQSGTATSTITITPVADTPIVANITTDEDTQSGAIVIDRNANDGAEVTHFRIDAITNGSLFQNDGITSVSDGDYITYAEGQLGVKFTPNANSIAAGSFTVEASEDGTSVAAQSGIATSTITITPVGDTPVVADITTGEDTQSGAIVIDRNANDGAEVTHFRIDGITNGTLFQNDGTTPIGNGEYITYAEGQLGVKFTPNANSIAAGSFTVEASEDGTTVAMQSGTATSTITITPIGDTPIVADITTDEDTQSGAIVIDRNANDGTEVTHFRIAAISNGALFQNDGTTPISNDEYITYAQGQAGVKFTPSANSNVAGTFTVESSEDGTSVAVQTGAAISTVTITPIGDTPVVADITTDEDTQSGAIVVDRNGNDGAEVTHFRIAAITNGSLFQNDGTTPISNGEYITYAQGQAGVKFTPGANVTIAGTFTVESSEDGISVAAQSGAAISTITITPISDTPVVADITTDEDTQSGAIVVDRNGNDGAEVTHFRVAAITNGSLFQNDGTTPISNGEYITYAQGQAGVKFTPGANVTTAGTFTVESSQDGASVAAQSGTATSTITITTVNDAPVIATNEGATVNEGETVTIDETVLNEGDVDDGGADLTYTITAAPLNGQLELTTAPGLSITSFTQADIDSDLLLYAHDGTETTSDSFSFQLADGGENGAVPAAGIFDISITPVNDKPVLDAIGPQVVDEDTLLEFTVTASDPEGDTLTYDAADLPAGASFDPATQTFSWTPDIGTAGVYYDVLLTVTDDGMPPQSDAEVITITVGDVNRPPLLSPIGNRQVDEGVTLTFVVTGSDPDLDALSFSASNLPTGASFDAATQIFSWTPNVGSAGVYTNVLFTVTDDGTPPESDAEVITITVGDVNRPPLLSPIGNRQVDEGVTLTFVVTGSDPDLDALSFSASNLPTGASFDAATQTFSWTPDFGSAGAYTNVLFTVTDDGTPVESDAEAITITVGDVNLPPVLSPIGNRSVDEGVTLAFVVTGSDPDGDGLSFSASNLPTGASFDAATQTFSWTPDFGSAGVYTNVLFTVTDDGTPSESDAEAVTITVGDVNRPPVLSPIGNLQVDEGVTLAFVVTGSDPDGDALSFSASNLPTGASFDAATQTFSWTPDFDAAGVYANVLFTVTDDGTPLESDSETIEIVVIPGGEESLYILEGPIVDSIDSTSATVEWLTNVASTGTVHYGTDTNVSSLIEGEQDTMLHRIELTNLASGTRYYVQVESEGVEDGQYGVSSLVSFVTLSAPDVTPPLIVSGPHATSLSDSDVVLIWTTDEPATSDVWLSDGTTDTTLLDDTLSLEHIVPITDLLPETAYTFVASSADRHGNGPVESDVTAFSTLAVPDTFPPVIIEGPVIEKNSHDTVVLRWTTDELSDAWVAYGVDDTLGSIQGNDVLAFTHHVAIVGLESDTDYYFQISSMDLVGNGPTESDLIVVRTLIEADTLPPLFTVLPKVIGRTDTTATIYWETDEPSDSVVEYGLSEPLTGRRSNPEKVLRHQVTLVGLEPGREYLYNCYSTDTSTPGNTASSSDTLFIVRGGDTLTFQTDRDPDITPPAIIGQAEVVATTDQSATIYWVTDEISNGYVTYWVENSNVTASVGESIYRTDHVITLTKLLPNTAYRYRVTSADVSGNQTSSNVAGAFTTNSVPDDIPPSFTMAPESWDITATMAAIAWDTDELASGDVMFGTNSDMLTHVVPTTRLHKEQGVLLTRLQPETTYYFRARSIDQSQNIALSSVGSFTTLGATLTISPINPTVEIGDSLQLTASSNDLSDTTFTWRSSDEAIATIDANGLLTALAVGNTMITVTGGGSGVTANTTVVVTETQENNGGGRACFIASATRGTPLATEIDILRHLRDTYLVESTIGKAFVDMYYRISPPIADMVAQHPLLAAIVRLVLIPVIWISRLLIILPKAATLSLLAGMGVLAMLRLRKNARKELPSNSLLK